MKPRFSLIPSFAYCAEKRAARTNQRAPRRYPPNRSLNSLPTAVTAEDEGGGRRERSGRYRYDGVVLTYSGGLVEKWSALDSRTCLSPRCPSFRRVLDQVLDWK